MIEERRESKYLCWAKKGMGGSPTFPKLDREKSREVSTMSKDIWDEIEEQMEIIPAWINSWIRLNKKKGGKNEIKNNK